MATFEEVKNIENRLKQINLSSGNLLNSIKQFSILSSIISDVYNTENGKKVLEGINTKYENIESICNYINKRLAKGEKIGIGVPMSFTLETKDNDGSLNNYVYLQGQQINLPFKDSNQKKDSIPFVGGHIMSVVGTTNDNKLIVSSWGKKFTIDPCSRPSDLANQYVIYKYD